MEGEAGNVEDARELFRRALAVKANPQTLSAMATLERRCMITVLGHATAASQLMDVFN